MAIQATEAVKDVPGQEGLMAFVDDIEPHLLTRMADVRRCTFFVITVPSYQGVGQPDESKTRRKNRGRRASS